MKPPEGIQAYTVQMPQPSEDRISRNLPKVKPEKYQNVGSCQLLRQVKVCQLFPLGAPCAPVLLRNPRPALAAVAAACFPQAPGWASAPGALCRATQTKPGSRGQAKKAPGRHQDRIIQNRNVFCMYPGDSYKILILYVSVSDGKTRAAGASHQLTRPGRKPPSPNGPPGAARPQTHPPGKAGHRVVGAAEAQGVRARTGQFNSDLSGKISFIGFDVLHDSRSQYPVRTGSIFGTLHHESCPNGIRQPARCGMAVLEFPKAFRIQITRHHFHLPLCSIRAW